MPMITNTDFTSLQALPYQTFPINANNVQYQRNSHASSYGNFYTPYRLYQQYSYVRHGQNPNQQKRKRKADYCKRNLNPPEGKQNLTYGSQNSYNLDRKRQQENGYHVQLGQQRYRTLTQEQMLSFDHNQTAPLIQHIHGSQVFESAVLENHLSLTYPCPNFQQESDFYDFSNHCIKEITPDRVSIKSTNSSYNNSMTDFDTSHTFDIFTPKATSTPYTSPEPEVQNLSDVKDISYQDNLFVVPEPQVRAPRRTKKFRYFLSEDEEAVYYLITKYLATETE